MKWAFVLLVSLGGCRCGTHEVIAVRHDQAGEAGPNVLEVPPSLGAPLPGLDEAKGDEASVERTLIEMKRLGLTHLVDGGP